MTRTGKITTIFLAITIALLVALMATYIAITNNKIDNYKEQLNNTYQSNVYSLGDEMDNIEVTLSKINVSNSKTEQEKYLTELVSLCKMAQNSLSSLPIEHNLITNTYKFVNQLSGYAYALNENMSKGGSLSTQDKQQLQDLHASSQEIKNEINNLIVEMSLDYSIVDNISPNAQANGFSQNFSGIFDETIKYPSLIYDGPFSDAIQNKEVKGLMPKVFTQTEAEDKVKKLFGEFEVTFDDETNSKDFETYNFSLKKDSVSGYVQITKKGGFVLSYNIENNGTKVTKSIIECEFIAQEFAKKMGIENAEIVWSQDANSCVYCNICYVQQGIIIYPDMVKVKVCRQTGDVIGFEAQSWAYNHTERKIESPQLSQEQARAKLNANMEEISARLCVIPTEYSGEKLAWEFKCYCDGAIYYVYINANTGEELDVQKVIHTENGNLLM